MASSEIEKRKSSVPAVDPEEEPSAEWGWHGTFPKGTAIAGIFVGIVMFLYITTSRQGLTADLYLIATGIILLAGVGWMIHRRRTSWRR